MGETRPLLSIGMPVYNGERYLAAALGSLLDQTFTDFELIVSDNASDDATAEIAQAFAAADRRIQYHRAAENRGAAWNYNRTLDLARGPYFKWAAHDDVCAPRFLERCIEVLEREPETLLCHAQSLRIDALGRVTGRYPHELETIEKRPAARFWRMISTPHHCIPVFGVMRSAALRGTPRHGAYVGADRNLLAELALMGHIRLVPEPLFMRRDHPNASISRYPDERERLAWFNPRLAGQSSRPTWRRLSEYRASIRRRVELSALDRIACHAVLLRWLSARHHTGPRNAWLLARELIA